MPHIADEVAGHRRRYLQGFRAWAEDWRSRVKLRIRLSGCSNWYDLDDPDLGDGDCSHEDRASLAYPDRHGGGDRGISLALDWSSV